MFLIFLFGGGGTDRRAAHPASPWLSHEGRPKRSACPIQGSRFPTGPGTLNSHTREGGDPLHPAGWPLVDPPWDFGERQHHKPASSLAWDFLNIDVDLDKGWNRPAPMAAWGTRCPCGCVKHASTSESNRKTKS